MIQSGELKRMVDEGLLGVTSNPTIFDKAISGSDEYDGQLRDLLRGSPTMPVEELIRSLMVRDIQMATDILAPVYERTRGRDGYVSVEVTPGKAHDAGATVEEASLLWRLIDRKNLMVKIPATQEGLSAIEESVAAGLNINVTLIFSVERYRDVAEAYLKGLERRLAAGQSLSGVASVASVFVSRIDTLVDELLLVKVSASSSAAVGEARGLPGKAAVANTKLVYAAFKEIFFSPRFQRLSAKGAAVQRPLWGSTSTKNPAYYDLMYVEPLIGPDTVNTVPPATYAALFDHGKAAATIESDLDGARAHLAALGRAGIDLDAVMAKLEKDGVAAFAKSFDGLYANIQKKRAAFVVLA
jgi:transaldolase